LSNKKIPAGTYSVHPRATITNKALTRVRPPLSLLLEREFFPGADPKDIREFMQDDCACEIDSAWDLWEHNLHQIRYHPSIIAGR
jgi:hypothetical protein